MTMRTREHDVITTVCKSNQWVVLGGSAIGQRHLKNGESMQDRHKITFLDDNKTWGIAVICDGAGSSKHSDLAAELIVNEISAQMKKLCAENFLWHHKRKKLPSKDRWRRDSRRVLSKVAKLIPEYSKQHNIPVKELYCTVIVVIFTPLGLLTAHVGDGRGGYCTNDGEWKPFMKPYRGKVKNSTVFIVPKIFKNKTRIKKYVRSRVIKEPVAGFTIMSDGCESFAYLCNVRDEATGSLIDPNVPFHKFFQPLTKWIGSITERGFSEKSIQGKWGAFLEGKTSQPIANERDDKTLIVGVSL